MVSSKQESEPRMMGAGLLPLLCRPTTGLLLTLRSVLGVFSPSLGKAALSLASVTTSATVPAVGLASGDRCLSSKRAEEEVEEEEGDVGLSGGPTKFTH